MPKLVIKQGGTVIEAVPIEINGEPHSLRFDTLALASLEQQLDLDIRDALEKVREGVLAGGRFNFRLTLAFVAAGLAHEALAIGADLPTWIDLAPCFERNARALAALIPQIGEAVSLAFPAPKTEEQKNGEPNPSKATGAPAVAEIGPN